MSALRRYQTFLLVLLLGTVTLAYLLNTTVNPLRVTPTAWSSSTLDPYRDIDNTWNRTAKAGLVRSGTWTAAIFGSSRVDIALDPSHTLFDGLHCANLGLNAGSLNENHAIFSYFMDREDPELVVFAIDAGDLTTAFPRRNVTDFSLSPLDPNADKIERELRYHEGISTLAASFATLGRSLAKQPAEHSPQGYRLSTPFPNNQRRLMAGLYLSTTLRMVESRKAYARLNTEKVDLLRDIVRRCNDKGVRLIFLITPNHALFQLAYRELGDPDPFFSKDRLALAELAGKNVEIWDFLDAHPLNTEALPPESNPKAHLENWVDLFHSTPTIGNLMLDRITGVEGDYGTRLTPEMIPTHVEQIEQGLDAYTIARPDDLRFLQESLSKFQTRP